jgi:hypothetical protein
MLESLLRGQLSCGSLDAAALYALHRCIRRNQILFTIVGAEGNLKVRENDASVDVLSVVRLLPYQLNVIQLISTHVRTQRKNVYGDV